VVGAGGEGGTGEFEAAGACVAEAPGFDDRDGEVTLFCAGAGMVVPGTGFMSSPEMGTAGGAAASGCSKTGSAAGAVDGLMVVSGSGSGSPSPRVFFSEVPGSVLPTWEAGLLVPAAALIPTSMTSARTARIMKFHILLKFFTIGVSLQLQNGLCIGRQA